MYIECAIEEGNLTSLIVNKFLESYRPYVCYYTLSMSPDVTQ